MKSFWIVPVEFDLVDGSFENQNPPRILTTCVWGPTVALTMNKVGFLEAEGRVLL